MAKHHAIKTARGKGTRNPAGQFSRLKDGVSIEEYAKWIQEQGITSTGSGKKPKETHFIVFSRNHEFPPGYPRDPVAYYKRRGTWKGWAHLFGKETHFLKDKAPSIEEYKKLMQKLGIKTKEGLEKYAKSKLPPGYPKRPDDYYKRKGTWDGWNNFFGTETHYLTDPPSIEEYSKWVQKLGIKTMEGFEKYAKSKLPPGYPRDPDDYYKRKGTWDGWSNFFGTGVMSSLEKSKNWLPIKEAKIEACKIAKELGITKQKEWIEAHKTGKIPANLPRYLYDIYGDKKRKKK